MDLFFVLIREKDEKGKEGELNVFKSERTFERGERNFILRVKRKGT
jgi:hypothetical protein